MATKKPTPVQRGASQVQRPMILRITGQKERKQMDSTMMKQKGNEREAYLK